MKEFVSFVVRAQSGDRAAFATIVRQFQDMAVGYAYSILGDFQLAEDAAQEAFVQAYLDLQKLREPHAFPSWFRRLVCKYCDRQFRGKRLWTVPIDDARDLASKEPGPMKYTEHREIGDRVMDAIQSLPEHERVVTTLFYINGYSQAEVGEFLDVPVSTVKSRLHLARKKLQERMTDMVEETLKQHAPGKDFTRKVEEILDGVENVEWKKGCNCFSGSVVSCMKFLKEDITYHFVAGVSGVAFHIQWAWAPDNCAPEVTLGEEIVRRAFWALGYEYTLTEDFEKSSPENSEDVWRQRIIKNINNGRPVIARGVVGPPECCVIAGYAQEGDVLLGRSYFYKDSKGYFRQADWYKNCFGILEIGKKIGAPPKRQIIHETLEWAIELARTPERNERATGFAAYDIWADALERDEDFPEDNMEVLTLRCMATINDGFGYQADVRWAASEFLSSIADECGEADTDLKTAAKAYKEESDLHCQGMKLGPSCFAPDEEKRRIADRKLRFEIAHLIREAGAKNRKAIEHIERAFSKLP
jgi:RNA polymerase sigma factor (sigma-70 family)